MEFGHNIQTEQSYAPLESMTGSSTEFMMREFIRRAVFSDGTKDYRIPPEPEAGDTVRIRLRTARGNAFAAVLVTNEQRIQMSVVSSDALFDYYEATLTIGEENISYYFLIWSGDKYYYYNQTGVTEAPDPTYDFKIMPGFKTPDWAKGAVMYQIFVDRFCNGNGVNEVADHEYAYLGKHVQRVFRWDALPETDDIRRFYGGDLNGVLSKLSLLSFTRT